MISPVRILQKKKQGKNLFQIQQKIYPLKICSAPKIYIYEHIKLERHDI